MALTALQIRHAKTGMHADGNGLYLLVLATGLRYWVFRFQRAGRRREMGLGAVADVSLARARQLAAALRVQVRSGVDPIDDRREQRSEAVEAQATERAKAVSFEEAARGYIESQRSGWRNAKHADQWLNTLTTYAFPVFGKQAVGDVDTAMVLRALQPIWTTKTETASRVRARIEAILDFARVRGWRASENAARWRGHLAALLPKPSRVKTVRHHAALPWQDLGGFMVLLRECSGISARALEFAILTAARSGEVRLATWSEIDLTARMWTVPAERMKARREHRVPLSDEAVTLLQELPVIVGEPLVFPGAREGKPLSDMSLTAVLKRMGRAELTAHGFRSTFRDWAAEATHFPSEMAEMALAHVVGDKVEAAYRRGDLFEKRRAMMQAWADWSRSGSKVRSIRHAAGMK